VAENRAMASESSNASTYPVSTAVGHAFEDEHEP
jgi:hypothetical protein